MYSVTLPCIPLAVLSPSIFIDVGALRQTYSKGSIRPTLHSLIKPGSMSAKDPDTYPIGVCSRSSAVGLTTLAATDLS